MNFNHPANTSMLNLTLSTFGRSKKPIETKINFAVPSDSINRAEECRWFGKGVIKCYTILAGAPLGLCAHSCFGNVRPVMRQNAIEDFTPVGVGAHSSQSIEPYGVMVPWRNIVLGRKNLDFI